MSAIVDRIGVQRLLAEGGVLLDVLPDREYEDEHLPGARSLPLTTLDAGSAGQLPVNRPLIVYCFDGQ